MVKLDRSHINRTNFKKCNLKGATLGILPDIILKESLTCIDLLN